jgi:hypothetical protein
MHAPDAAEARRTLHCARQRATLAMPAWRAFSNAGRSSSAIPVSQQDRSEFSPRPGRLRYDTMTVDESSRPRSRRVSAHRAGKRKLMRERPDAEEISYGILAFKRNASWQSSA